MAEQEHISKFTADVADFVDPIATAANAMDTLANAGDRAKSVFNAFDKQGNVFAQTLKLETESLYDLTVTLKETEKGVRATSAALTENSRKMGEARKAAAAYQKEIEKNLQTLNDLREAQLGAPVSAGRTTSVGGKALAPGQSSISEMAEMDRSILHLEQTVRATDERLKVENKKALEQMAKDWGNSLVREADQHDRTRRDMERREKQFVANIQNTLKGIRGQTERDIATANAAAGTSVSQQLLARFAPAAGSNPREVLQITSQIGRIQDLITKGSISSQRAIEVVNTALKGQAEVFNGVERQVAQSALAMRDLGSVSEQTAQKINLPWGTLVRIGAIQILHRAIYDLIAAFNQSISIAAEFQVKVSEIRTISQNAQRTSQEWAQDLRRLSDQFNRPIEDVAKATYEAISNQIAKGADATIFLEKSLRFSQATVSTTAQSVDLLSSALNAYQLSAEQTDRVSAILFKTIDLGRVTAGELSSTFGRVAVPASQLGVSLEETAASIATLTINGVKASEALTQINTLFVSLLKPSREMTALFKEWGVGSGEAAIATFGFDGVLRKLAVAANGSSTELAALVRNARGLRGALGLTGDFAGFERTLAQIRAAGPEFANAVQIATESPGFKLQQQLNEVRNMLINDFGIPATKVITELGDAFGGLDNIVRGFIRTLAGVAETFIIYKIATASAAGANNLLATAAARVAVAEQAKIEKTVISTGATRAETLALQARTLAEAQATAAGLSAEAAKAAGIRASNAVIAGNIGMAASFRSLGASIGGLLSSPLFLIGLGVAAFQVQQSQLEALSHRREEIAGEIQAENQKLLDSFQKEQQGERSAFETNVNARFRKYLQHVADVRRLSQQSAADQIKNQKDVLEATKTILELSIGRQRDAIRELESEQRRSVDAIKQAQRELDQNLRAGDRRNFERTIALAPEDQKFEILGQRLKELKEQATAFFAAGNVEEGSKKISEGIEIINERFRRTNEIRQKLQELQKQQIELNTREAATSGILASRENLRSIQQQHRIATARSKNAGFVQEDIGATNARDELTSAEQLRRIDEQRADLAEKITKLQQEYGFAQLLSPGAENLRFRQEETELLKLQKQLVEQLNAAETRRQELIQAQVAKEKERVERLKDVFTQITQVKAPKASDPKALQDTLAEFDRLVREAQGFGLTDQSVLFQLQQQRAEIWRSGNLQIAQAEIDDTAKRLGTIKDMYIKTFDEIQTAQKKALEGKTGALGALEADLTAALEGAFQSRSGGTRGPLDQISAQLEGMFNKLKAGGASTAADFKLLTDSINKIAEFDPNILAKVIEPGKGIGGRDKTIGDLFGDAQNQLIKFNAAAKDSQSATTAMADLQKEAAAAGIAIGNISGGIIDANKAGDKFGTDFKKKLQDLRLETQMLNQQLDQLKSGGGAPIATPQRFSFGGMARGRDIVPAMLAVGEYVMTPEATRMFYPQLRNMNAAASRPQYFSQGGDVNFGEVNFNIPGGGTPETNARAVWAEIQRLARQGVIKK